jgi:hypothetical protein
MTPPIGKKLIRPKAIKQLAQALASFLLPNLVGRPLMGGFRLQAHHVLQQGKSNFSFDRSVMEFGSLSNCLVNMIG